MAAVTAVKPGTAPSDFTHTGDTNWTAVTNANLASGSFSSGDYIIFCSAQINGNNANGVFGARLTQGGTQINQSLYQFEPNSASLNWDGSYAVMFRFTQPGTPVTIELEIATIDSGASTVNAQDIKLFALREDSLPTNCVYAEDDDLSTPTALTTTYADFASLTWTPSSGGDAWLVLSYIQVDVDSTSEDFRARQRLDGTATSPTESTPSASFEGEDGAEVFTAFFSRVYTLTAASHTAAVNAAVETTSSAYDHRFSSILRIRLADFVDSNYSWVAATHTMAASGIVYELLDDTAESSADVTPTSTGDFFVVGTAIAELSTGTTSFENGALQVRTNPSGGGLAVVADHITRTNDPTDEKPLSIFFLEQFTSGASRAVELWGAADDSTQTLIQHRSIVAFSLEKASSGVTSTVAMEAPNATLAAVATESLTATATVEAPSSTIAATATESLTSTAGVTAPSAQIAAVADQVNVTAAVTMAAPNATLAATATESLTAAVTVESPGATLAAAATESLTGTATVEAPSASLAATATESMTAAVTVEAPSAQAAAAAAESMTASAAVEAPSAQVAATAAESMTASAAVEAPSGEIAATATESITASVTVEAPSGEIAATSTHSAGTAVTSTVDFIAVRASLEAAAAQTLVVTGTVTFDAPSSESRATVVESFATTVALEAPSSTLSAAGTATVNALIAWLQQGSTIIKRWDPVDFDADPTSVTLELSGAELASIEYPADNLDLHIIAFPSGVDARVHRVTLALPAAGTAPRSASVTLGMRARGSDSLTSRTAGSGTVGSPTQKIDALSSNTAADGTMGAQTEKSGAIEEDG